MMNVKKDKALKKGKADVEQERKEALQKYNKEVIQYKQKMKPLVQFLRKHHLNFNYAKDGEGRIEYFRIDEFQKLIKDNSEEIQKNQDLKALIKNYKNELIFLKRPKEIRAKYPDKLQIITPTDSESEKKFATFRFDTTEYKKWMIVAVVAAVLLLVLFPVWPYEVKYAIWLISLILLVFLVGIIVLRILVYLFCVIAGFNVWILPNLLDSSLPVTESFFPIIECSKWEKNWFNIFLRLFALFSVTALCIHIYLTPTFFQDHFDFTKETIDEIHDWGVRKIKNQGNFSQRGLPHIDDILNQTAESINRNVGNPDL